MKKLILLTDDSTLDVLAGILVEESVDIHSLEEEIQKIKNENPGEWTVSTILEGISIKYEEFKLEAVYI